MISTSESRWSQGKKAREAKGWQLLDMKADLLTFQNCTFKNIKT
jgi:hypothetical protein